MHILNVFVVCGDRVRVMLRSTTKGLHRSTTKCETFHLSAVQENNHPDMICARRLREFRTEWNEKFRMQMPEKLRMANFRWKR